MLKAAGGGKKRTMQWTESGDPGLKYLSYYTDNGAFYCCLSTTVHAGWFSCTLPAFTPLLSPSLLSLFATRCLLLLQNREWELH